MPIAGERTMKSAVFVIPEKTRTLSPPFHESDTDQTADQGMGGAARQAEVPGDQVPGDRPAERREDHRIG